MEYLYRNLIKNGKTAAGTQRFLDKETNKTFIDPLIKIHNEEKRKLAIKMYIDEGNSYRAVARMLGVTHPTVMKWVLEEARKSDYTQLVDYDSVNGVQIDEIYTIINKKKEDGNTNTSL